MVERIYVEKMPAFAQEGLHAVRHFQHLGQLCFVGCADKHIPDRCSGMPNPRHRCVDVGYVDPRLQIGQRQQHCQA